MYNIYPKTKYQSMLDGVFTFEKVNLFCEKNKNVFIFLEKIVKINLVDETKANLKYRGEPFLSHPAKEQNKASFLPSL